ncbi:unnamed protein product, partial [Ascophyllum nodosum]
MTRMTGPDCAVMYNLINTHTHTNTHTHSHTRIHTRTTPRGLAGIPQQRATAVVAVVASRVACSHLGGREGSACSPLHFLWGSNVRVACVAVGGLYGLLVGRFGLRFMD